MKRIQRKRTKGWKMPANTVYVGRPSKWGNPFKLMGDMVYVDASHRRKVFSPWVLFYDDGGFVSADVVKLFRDLMMDLNSHKVEEPIYKRFRLMRDTIRNLEGKDLACWCREDCQCHADVFLELLNVEPNVAQRERIVETKLNSSKKAD